MTIVTLQQLCNVKEAIFKTEKIRQLMKHNIVIIKILKFRTYLQIRNQLNLRLNHNPNNKEFLQKCKQSSTECQNFNNLQ